MYKQKAGHPDCSLVQRVANKGSECRLPTTVFSCKGTVPPFNNPHKEVAQKPPTDKNQLREHQQFARGGKS